MKPVFLSVLLLLGVASLALSQEEIEGSPIDVSDLNRRPVIGKLGLPLGTAAEIRATIFAGRKLQRKGFDSLYLLKISHVNGEKLDTAPLLEFSVPPFADVALARNHFDLHALKNGETAPKLDAEKIKELEKGYVGRSVRLVAYESGGFRGAPKNRPKDVPVWTDRSFHFSTSLTVLAERK